MGRPSERCAPGTPPATNVVTKIHNGCVILESWSAPGMTGQSFNIYDRVARRWRQTWVDSTGGLHDTRAARSTAT